MYPITSDVKALFESEQRQALRITGTDKNGVAINITDADIIIDSFNIDRYSCNGEKLEIGTAIASEMTLKLDNFDGRFNDIVFEGTELFVELGIYDEEHTGWHWIPCGYFTPDEQPRSLSTISIHALDRMTRFDAVSPVLTPWTDENGNVMTDNNGQVIYFAADVTLPVPVANLVNQICIRCQIPFTQNMSGIPNWSLQIDEIPVLQQEITFRNLIQWCAGIMGCNAWIDWTGSLRFSWYSATTDYTCTPANRYSSDLYEDDITITGVTYTNTKNATLISGSADYAVDMTGNYLAASKITQILVNVKNYISGYTYRPFSASVINAPYLWPMDRITFTDKDGNNHACAVTNVSFGINGTTALAGKGETAQTNSGTAPSGVTTEQGFLIERAAEVTREFDESLTQEEIFNRLTDGGQIQGLILNDGKVYLNASYIQTGTLSADFIYGGTLELGGFDNIIGRLVIRDNNGNEIGYWDNTGIHAERGTFSGELNAATGTFNGTMSANGITSGTISADRIAANSIGVAKLTGTISGGNSWLIDLDNGTMSIGNLSAANITSGTLSADRIAANSIAVAKLTGTISGGDNWSINLDNGTMTIGTISANNITAGTMSANRISGGTLKLGGSNNTNGKLLVYNASNSIVGQWDNDGIEIKSGQIAIRPAVANGFGMNIGPYGDIAVGNEPSDLSSFYNNKCGFQVNNSGQVKAGLVRVFAEASTGIYYSALNISANHTADSNLEINRGALFKITNSADTAVTNVMHLATNKAKFWNMLETDNAKVKGTLTVSGTKSRVVSTDQYADRLLYCYETPSPMFGDVGEGTIGEDGRCYVWLDPVFAQTITPTQYQVFLQPYGDGKCYISERKGGYFVVEGTPGLAFGWELKAKQKDFDQRRLENAEQPYQPERFDYGAAASTHIDEIKKERAIA